MNVTDTDPVKVAVLTGYGETENTVLQNLLKTNSYVIESVNITLTDKISEDYDFVFMFGPDKDYSVADINKLDTWLDNSGKFGKNLVYVGNPKLGDSPNIDGLLDQWGLKVEKGYHLPDRRKLHLQRYERISGAFSTRYRLQQVHKQLARSRLQYEPCDIKVGGSERQRQHYRAVYTEHLCRCCYKAAGQR